MFIKVISSGALQPGYMGGGSNHYYNFNRIEFIKEDGTKVTGITWTKNGVSHTYLNRLGGIDAFFGSSNAYVPYSSSLNDRAELIFQVDDLLMMDVVSIGITAYGNGGGAKNVEVFVSSTNSNYQSVGLFELVSASTLTTKPVDFSSVLISVKFLFEHQNRYKSYQDNEWQDISIEEASERGMKALPKRILTTDSFPMNVINEGLFSLTLNTKTNIDLRKMKVQSS